jgi:subtilisin-like proprotein convertase family protein
MWVYNNDLQKWYRSDDTLLKSDFDFLKQELSSTRFYSKALSGSAYMIINDLNNMYGILNSWKPRNWYINTIGSKYSKSINPKYYEEPIDITSQYDFYNKNIKEYSLSLKNLFTPDRVINEFMENYIEVDLATDTSLNLSLPIEKIDGVKLIEGHKVLIKNQTDKSNLNINDDPNDFFEGYYKISNTVGTSVEYEYFNEFNGIYTYKGGLLIKSTDYDNYEKCIRLSVHVSMGNSNAGKQFHLNRLLNGFYPKNGDPMYFTEGHNWMVRNRVDYNNLFETNYFDILVNPSEKVVKNNVTYSIPKRIIQIGEFGVFTNTQFGKTNLIDCKWKVNLRSISQTEKYYWVCGDNTTLLKVDKTNFEMEFIKIETFSSFKSIKFYDNLRGVLVGDFNNIYITDDGGLKWKELRFQNFNSYSYNKVLFKDKNKFYVCGNGGVFIEFNEDIDGWTAHKRRISQKTEDADDLLLVDKINDMILLNNVILLNKNMNNVILLATNDSKLIIYDADKKTGYDFIYLYLDKNYGDIKNISSKVNKNDFLFSNDNGVYEFSMKDFKYLVGNSNVSKISTMLETSVITDNSLILNLDASNPKSYPGTGVTWTNLSNSSMSGKLYGNVSYKSESLKTSSLSFGGSNADYFSTDININRTETMSWNVWFNQTSTTPGNNFPMIFSHFLPYLCFLSNKKFRFSFYSQKNGIPDQKVLETKNTYQNNVWYNVCCTLHINTKSGDISAKLYVNGLLENESFYKSESYELYNPPYKLNIGGNFSVNSGVYPFNGRISSLQIYNRILSASEVFQNYDTEKSKYSTFISDNIKYIFNKSVNKILNYKIDNNNEEIYLVGNYSLNKLFNSSTNTFDDIDKTFYSRLKSKLVFLNYDIASKLNFFTDEGEYRLPNSLFIQADYFSSNSVIKLDNLNINGQNQLTWYDYWMDKEKTFKYGTTSLIEANSIKPSLVFKGTSNLNSVEIFKISATSSNSSMYNDLNFNKTKLDSWNGNNNNYNLYLKGNLMALYNWDGRFSVEEGDILRMESSLVDANFLVNKIDTKWIYMYSSFNDNIITNLTKGVSVKFKNLNKFKDYNSFISNFNNHSIGIGYKTSLVNNSVKIESKFNNLTSYYNLSTQVTATSSTTTSSFTKFSSPDMLNYSIPDGSNSVAQILNCDTNIFPNDIELTINIVHSNTKDLIVNLIGPNNKIINVFNQPTTITSNPLKINAFSKTLNIGTTAILNGNIIQNISNVTTLSDLLVNGSAKGDWKLVVEDKVGGVIGYLKNWSITFYGYISESMKYTDGFLKFGYTPRYNLLDYLTSINDPLNPNRQDIKPYFYADKEYLSLPTYYNLPLGPLVSDGVWMNSSGQTGVKSKIQNDNKIYFGDNLKFEWTSILLNTFVDIEVFQNGSTIKSNKMLVINKYYDYITNAYVIEFHKMINFTIGTTLTGGWINIISRRKLSQISEDLGEFNNIHTKLQTKNNLSSYDNYLNFKITTDNYINALLSDVDTYKNITGIVYTDYKNELAMNFTNIGKEVVIPIVNTANINGKLYIKCLDKHGLIDGQGVVLEFNGGQFSSQYLNQQYFGYQTVNEVYNEYEFLVNVNYGQDVYIGNDSGFIKYYKKDPFFNYQPVDIMDVSLNKEIKQAILLNPENTKISGSNWSLVNVDFTKYRYRLVDGLTIQELNSDYQWILEAEISDAILGKNDSIKSGMKTSKDIVWYSGNWEFGRWFGGIWYSGIWMYGDWYDGIWMSKSIQDKKLSVEVNTKDQNSSNSVWMNGRWFGGNWNNGVWLGGRFYDGTWENGWWYNGVWNRGTWENGSFIGGIWVDGTWENGTFNCKNEPSFWINGTWNGGDFENGIWYNGTFNQKNSTSRFGWGALASRPAYWNGGFFNGGSFYSGSDMEYGVSKRHTYAVWKTGKFINGDFYGGVVYNIDMKNSNWIGGISEEIEVIGLNEYNNSFILNGIFRFNIGDEINILSKTKDFEEFGSLENPMLYTIVKVVLDEVNKVTEIFVDLDIILTKYKGYYKSETKRGKSMLVGDTTGQTVTMDGKNSISNKSILKTINNYVYNEVPQTKKILDVRVRIKLENIMSNENLSTLSINLNMPNGKTIKVKESKNPIISSNLYKDAIFSNNSQNDLVDGHPFYDGVFKNLNKTDLSLENGINKGYWVISISCDKLIKINDVYLEFCYDDGIGAQIGSPIENGFDTGLRVVSYFKNTRWKSGIWENGIFEDDVWESGIWYDGIFNGEWV